MLRDTSGHASRSLVATLLLVFLTSAPAAGVAGDAGHAACHVAGRVTGQCCCCCCCRLQVLQEMLDMLRDHQQNHHSARLEWIIIWLIAGAWCAA
jgi:hypothetical protein